MYHTLEFGDVCLGLVDPDGGLLNRLRPGIQLLVELIGPVDECPALIIED